MEPAAIRNSDASPPVCSLKPPLTTTASGRSWRGVGHAWPCAVGIAEWTAGPCADLGCCCLHWAAPQPASWHTLCAQPCVARRPHRIRNYESASRCSPFFQADILQQWLMRQSRPSSHGRKKEGHHQRPDHQQHPGSAILYTCKDWQSDRADQQPRAPYLHRRGAWPRQLSGSPMQASPPSKRVVLSPALGCLVNPPCVILQTCRWH